MKNLDPRNRNDARRRAAHQGRRRLGRIIGRMVIALLALVTLVYAANATMIHLVHREVYQDNLTFVDQTPLDAVMDLGQDDTANDPSFAPLEKARPFAKRDAFGEDAYCWSNQFSQYGAAGILVFDANGDGRLDVYFCQDGQNWTRPTDKDGVLMDAPRFQYNGLFINRGNDDDGAPTFSPAGELAKRNDRFVAEELLVEDYLYPRSSTADDQRRPGRGSNTAVAADFNGDGRIDLLVGNTPRGMIWSHPDTQRVLMQFVNPVGREAKKSKQPLSAMGLHLVDYVPDLGVNNTRKSARGIEAEGANSLYLNMGDEDGDGLPEWRDASRETGIEGKRATFAFNVADIDLDGDLDIFVANSCEDDYWIGGSKYWAGGVNCLYLNQLAETGELRFVERGGAMDVDGVYDEDYPMPHYYRLRRIPFLPAEYSLLFMKFEAYQPEYLVINGEEGEHGQVSWASVMQDVNGDGYEDVWVANDMGYLRLYLNEQGKRFVRTDHARSQRSGYWMSFAAGDFNGDLQEDLFVGNLGGAVMNHAFVTPDPFDLFEPVILNATIFAQFYGDKHDTRHALIDGADFGREMANRVRHSKVLPPDVTLPNNYRRHVSEDVELPPFDPDTINAYEFSWGSTTFDAQNDGRTDIYYVGCLYGRGGGLFPIAGTGPGRFLVNATRRGEATRFADQTAEHHLFNIEELDYGPLEEHGYITRKAPRQNWRARDVVNSYDRSIWSRQGPTIQERVTNQDMIQAAENGRAVVGADLNGDGFDDIVLRNKGGYDSRSSKSGNLKAMIDGRPQVIPAHDHNYPSPTNYEPGRTWLLVNRYADNHWLKVRLVDDTSESFNRDAIGARVIVNARHLGVKRCGDGGFMSNRSVDLSFGLGSEVAREIEIRWPDAERSVTHLELDDLHNCTVIVSKRTGNVEILR
ncbi:MAG: hypothetical protein CMJ18_13020 [Phycisphaeraceae bacterium]|nr:hypothetical protein [Phycisphaeraceae bacterium]